MLYFGLLRPGTYTAAKTWMQDVAIKDVALEMLGDMVAKDVAQMPLSSEIIV